jgi:hypothetical protein
MGLGYLGADVDQESLLPTTERVGTALFGEPETKEEAAGRISGSLLGPSAALKILRGAGTLGKGAFIGRVTEPAAEAARKAEALGFKLEPRQVRAEGAKPSLGLSESTRQANQKLANELASSETGVKVDNITRTFIAKRENDLGKQYNVIFNRPIGIDRGFIQKASDFSTFESAIDPAGSAVIRRAANNLVNRYNALQANTTAPIRSFRMDGKELQAIRSEVSYQARNAADGSVRFRAGELLAEIDASISRTNPASIASDLAKTNRQYAATKTLEELLAKGGIDNGNISLQKLGEQLSQNIYGFGSGTSKHPLLELGTLGRDLNIAGRFELPAASLATTLRTTMGALPRSQAARRIQRGMPTTGQQYPRGVGPEVTIPSTAAGRVAMQNEYAP